MPGTPRQRAGRAAERFVEERLGREGYRVLARNARVGRLEIDLVLRSPAGWIVFCEVRARRRGGPAGVHPAETVTPEKQRRLRRAAAGWLAREGADAKASGVRFDVAAVWLDEAGRPVEMEHFEGAF